MGGQGWWIRDVCSSSAYSFNTSSIEINPSTKYPAIAYHNYTGGINYLMLHCWNGTSWSDITFDSNNSAETDSMNHLDMAIDHYGTPNFMYNRGANLCYGYYSGGSCVKCSLSAAYPIRQLSLKLYTRSCQDDVDASIVTTGGDLHNVSLRYGGSWTFSSPLDGDVKWSNIAYRANGDRVIVYNQGWGNPDTVQYRYTNNSNNWESHIVIDSLNIYSSIPESAFALDTDNNVIHVIYPKLYGINNELWYATGTVGSSSFYCTKISGYPYYVNISDLSLTIDTEYRLHGTYRVGPNLYFFNSSGGTWNITPNLDSEPNTGHGPSIILDENNFPHIAYYKTDGSTGGIKYARYTGVDSSLHGYDGTDIICFAGGNDTQAKLKLNLTQACTKGVVLVPVGDELMSCFRIALGSASCDIRSLGQFKTLGG